MFVARLGLKYSAMMVILVLFAFSGKYDVSELINGSSALVLTFAGALRTPREPVQRISELGMMEE